MKKTTFFSICSILLLINSNVFAQIEQRTKTFDLINLERHQFKLNLVAPGLSYELGIFKNVSASTSFGLGAASYLEGAGEGYTLGYAWHTRMRWYHNLERRKALGKNVAGNSGNYVAAVRSIFWGPLQLTNSLAPPDDFAIAVYGGVYGIQRTYEKGLNFGVELGGGYFRGDGIENGYGALLSFSFGWVATKRKSRKPIFD